MSMQSLKSALSDVPTEQAVHVWAALSREGENLFTGKSTQQGLLDLIAEIEGALGIKSLGGAIVGELISQDGGISPDLREQLANDRI